MVDLVNSPDQTSTVNKKTETFYHYYKYTALFEVGWNLRYVWYNKTLVEFDLSNIRLVLQLGQVMLDVRLSFASPNITCPGKTYLMLYLV